MVSLTERNESWPAQQLAEFLAIISVHASPADATRSGVERVAEALDAEVSAVVCNGCETVSVGFPHGQVPESALREIVASNLTLCDLAQLGACAIAKEPIDAEELSWLVVARAERALTGEEQDLLRGMARVLGLVREMVGRRLLLERVSEIQRQIVRRSPAKDVVNAIVAGAAELTASEVAVMYTADAGDPTGMTAVASHGLPRTQTPTRSELAGSTAAMMQAAVRELDAVAGSLVVASRVAGRRYSSAERAALETFAEHASMALTDAHMVRDAIHRALHDPLTGLPNRALFADRLEVAQHRAIRTGEKTAVLFLDIDRFKTVNDSLGHSFGDQLLIAAAGRLRGCLRPNDTAARFGGDEFAVLAEGADETVGKLMANRILNAFGQPFSLDGRNVHLGASIGITVVDGPGGDVLRDADLAMYHAKAQGRGRHELFNPAMRSAAQERLALESELRGAAERGELCLEYQPIVELKSAHTWCAEALVRWLHPTRGRLPPSEFIALAEETGEMAAIGRWVLWTACRQAAGWCRQGSDQVLVTVNLSPVQLYSTDIVSEVRSALRETGLSPEALILELTETVVMDDVATATNRLRDLKDLGVGLAIDDFGTGYCSLQYLRHFPIDYLKIAKSFLTDLDSPAADPSLTRGLVDIGTSFGLTVIAEGVERSYQRERLIELGCQLGQGFLFARPGPPDAIAQMMAEQRVLPLKSGPLKALQRSRSRT